MVPWPIALLTLYYGLVAATSAAMAWKALLGISHQPLIWPMAWLALSASAMCGLPLARAWGRRLAIWTSVLLIVATLAFSGILILAGRPGIGLLVTLSTAGHFMAIRYLQRPVVRNYFGVRNSECGMRSGESTPNSQLRTPHSTERT